MVDIFITYEGDLHCNATHGPSQARLETDAPVDNHGRGAAFSPTDLLATALGTCMITVMGILAQELALSLGGTTVHVKKHMTAAPPRRVARLGVKVVFPAELAAKVEADARQRLEQRANTCPVRLSLLDGIDVPIEYVWTS